MRIEINNFVGNLIDTLRAAGYRYDGQDPKTKEWRFYRSLSPALYPRFHIYCVFDKAAKELSFNLHLDQKAPVYEGVTAHGGDYDGPVVEKEANRLRAILNPEQSGCVNISE